MTRYEALEKIAEKARRMLVADEEAMNRPREALVELREALDALESDEWKHVKRGTTYAIVGEATAQAPIDDEDVVIVYRAEADGSLWVRRRDRFYDGRFRPREERRT